MKRTILHLSLLLLWSQAAFAQNTWVESGLKFGYGSARLYNKGIANWDYVQSEFRPCYTATAKFAVNYGHSHQVAIEGAFNQLAQKFTYPTGGTATGETTVNWNTVSSGLIYRYMKPKIYLEIGPEIDFVSSVSHDDKPVPDGQYYRKRYVSGMFGFGGYLWRSGIITLESGVRLHGGLTKFVTEEGAAYDYPIPQIGALSPVTDVTRVFRSEILIALDVAIGKSSKKMLQKRHCLLGHAKN